MEKLYSNLNKMYPLQKTLRFELIPIGETNENIRKNGILTEDEHRAIIYKKVKKYCDDYHKKFINEVLANVKLSNLDEYYKLYKKENRTDKENDEFKKIQKNLREEISKSFSTKKEFKGLFQKEMIQIYLHEMYKEDKDKISDISEFKKFVTYFTGFSENRKNMYVADEKSTAIAYRLINENLPIFISNIKSYEKVKELLKNNINQIYKDLKEYIQTNTINEMFELEYYNDVLTQTGIEIYNIVISGKSTENEKIKGINEYINEYNQKNKEKLPKLKELYKQILSDKIGTSFVIDEIKDDKELSLMILEYFNNIKKYFDDTSELENIYKNISNYDCEKMYINSLALTDISQKVYGDWSYINNYISNYYDENYTGKNKKGTEKYNEDKQKFFKSNKQYSLLFIMKCIEKENESFINYFKEYFSEELFNNVFINYKKIENKLNNSKENEKEFIKDEKTIEEIKNFLDSIKQIQEFIKILIPKDNTLEMDEKFYGSINEIYANILEIIPVYNKTRNYLTQKPYSTEKIKLNFETPTLLNGWDLNKETSNLAVILLKDDNYYLGIINPYNRKIFEVDEVDENSNYEKMEYKLLPGPNKMLPKVFFSNSGIEKFKPSEELLEKYNKGLHKKGENFDINFCHELIDFFKKSISKHEDWKNFNFKFSNTQDYNDISEFYNEVSNQGYKINFKKYSEKYINQLVKDGDLYLFHIYNKDFSKYSKGKPNLHTLYWKALFSEQNRKNVVYKLNGEAEIFYRKSSLALKDTAIHVANEPIRNKNINNPKKESVFEYDLIKNKRYTVDKFQFHVPITLNFINSGVVNINEIVNKKIKYSSDIHVIGIDRGERNLLYITVIDSQANIVHQESLNSIIIKNNNIEYKTDYHELLDIKEKERERARESWKTIENIKELKEGYMSQVIHKITTLMEKYNAIVVIEDLNKGFKNSRIKVEKQVYQKFEKMLIDKLSYLVFKDKKENEDGGILKAYQLVNEFKSFQKIGKQTGILFYIPAWCTSKIDPTTGFINLFYIKYESFEKSINFIEKIDNIKFNGENFEFYIDYNKFTDRLNDSKNNWVLYSNEDRIKLFRNPLKNNEWDSRTVILTDEFKILFERYNIDLSNIKEDILQKADVKFFSAVKEKDGIEGFISLFKLMIQMRNSIPNSMEDYLISPVKNKNGEFYDSRKCDDALPKDADANGAYNIARKGLMLIDQIKSTDDKNLKKIKYNITNKEWLKYAQKEEG